MSDHSTHGNPSFDKDYYRRFFSLYNKQEFQIYENWFQGWEKFIFNHLDTGPVKDKKVLEIGCSIGAFTKILKKRGFDVTATDISGFIIKKAKKLQKDVKFEVFDIEKGKSKNKFDYVFAFEVVEHLNDPALALANIFSLLNDGGKFIFSTPFPSNQSLVDPTHINVHQPQWWLKVGKKVGFRERRHVYATFIPYFYRYSAFFSRAFPIKINLPYINSTSIFIFKK